jgi:hypothetical protein
MRVIVRTIRIGAHDVEGRRVSPWPDAAAVHRSESEQLVRRAVCDDSAAVTLDRRGGTYQ